ncbi:14-3-3-like protein A [Tanacetum coccineum]
MEKVVSEEVKLFEEMVEFMEKISVRNVEELTIDDRKTLSVAHDKVNDAHREMSAVILSSSPAIDVSLIVKDYRSKIEKELNDICNKVSNLNIKLDINDYVDSFQHDAAAAAAYITYLEKRNKLTLESEDYQQTLEFMQELMVIARKDQVSEKDLNTLFHAYYMIMRVYRNLSYTIDSDLSSSIWDLDPSLIIDESRPKVVNELNFICNNMTNHTIKEAISQHLVKFADLTLSKTFILELIMERKRVSSQSMETTNKKSKLGSGDGEFWSDADPGFDYHDHSKRIKKKEDIFSQINAIFGDSEPGPLGKGIEIQHASTADDISEDDFLLYWDPECLEKGVDVQHDFTVDDSSEHIDNLAKMSNSSMTITSPDPTKVGSAKTKNIHYAKLSCWCLKGTSAKWRACNEYVWMLGLNSVPAYVVFLELPLASYRGDDETRWLVNGEQLISPVTKVIGLVECLIHFLIYAVPRGCLGLLDFSLYDDARNFKK